MDFCPQGILILKMFEELIELVRQSKVLYDTKIYYKNQSIRTAAWEEIAKILNGPGK